MNRRTKTWLIIFIATAVGYLPSLASAVDEALVQFRSLDDPAISVDPTICENAPFYDPNNPPNTLLGANLWSSQARASDGTVVNDTVRHLGVTRACTLITDLSVGARAPFYMEFNVNDLALSASGECVVISNEVPIGGLFLVGCALFIPPNTEQGILGGSVTSNSLFNPASIPGFQTGSFWTMNLYFE